MALYLCILVCFNFSVLLEAVIQDCSKVKLLFALDGTRNVDLAVYQRQTSIVENVLKQIPDGSSAYVYSIGQTSLNIVDIEYLKQADSSWVTTLSNFSRHEARGDDMSAIAIYELININFDRNRKRSKAEMMLIFIDHDIKGLNTTLAAKIGKKKLTIIPIGISEISANTLALAANKKHVLNMTADTNDDTLARSIVDIICQDSKFHCDTNYFQLPRMGGCRNCNERCNTRIQMNCLPGIKCQCDVCPYFSPTPFPTAQTLSTKGKIEKGKAGQIVITIGAVVSIVIVVVFLLVAYSIYIKYDCIKRWIDNRRHTPYAVAETQHDVQNGENETSFIDRDGDDDEISNDISSDAESGNESTDVAIGDDEMDASGRNDNIEPDVEGAVCDRAEQFDLPAVVKVVEENRKVLEGEMNSVNECRGMAMDDLPQ